MSVDMIPADEKPENFSFSSIRCVLSARQRARSFLQRWWIIASRTGATSDCSGIRATGKAFVLDAITKKQDADYNLPGFLIIIWPETGNS